MQRIQAEFDRGVSEARQEIANGILHLYRGVRLNTEWGQYLVESLRSHFGIDVIPISCFVDDGYLSHIAGFNSVVEAYLAVEFGEGALEVVLEDAQVRQKQVRDAYVVEKDPNEKSGPTDAD